MVAPAHAARFAEVAGAAFAQGRQAGTVTQPAQVVREADELDDEVEKRDYGEWLHAVLLAFHTARTEPGAVAAEVLNLHALADQVQLEKGLADADFLPFSASFAGFAPRYVAWLHERDADGARYLRGEDDITLQLPALGGVALHGVIDRIDHVRDPLREH